MNRHYFSSSERRWGKILSTLDAEVALTEDEDRKKMLLEVRRDATTARYIVRKIIAAGETPEVRHLGQYGELIEQLFPKLDKLGYL